MDCTLLPLKPVLVSKIWGGQKLGKLFGYPLPSDHTGECWGISAHPNGDCTVISGPFAGEKLSALWNDHRELFGNHPDSAFPLLVKIIDAKDDLSIQVHPDDAFAAANEPGERGKTECWYILDAEPESTIIIGHNASTREEMRAMVNENRWKELLRIIPVKKGDFFQINPGCLHAIRGGTLLLETQQSSDTTYRFYDYGRLENGKPRPLHVEKSLAVSEVPFVPAVSERQTFHTDDCSFTRLVSCPFYTVYHGTLSGTALLNAPKQFANLSITEGSCRISGMQLSKGSHAVICSDGDSIHAEGCCEFILSVP